MNNIKSANLEIQKLKKQLEESNRIINEQNMSIQQLKGNLKEEQQKVRVIQQKAITKLSKEDAEFFCAKYGSCTECVILRICPYDEYEEKTSAEIARPILFRS